MVRERIPETEGVAGETAVESYDRLMKKVIKREYLDTKTIIKTGIKNGTALEIGPGPGYLGIEWLKKTRDTFLKGLDINKDMLTIAQRNASEFGVSQRVEYKLGNAKQLPFDDETFDAVFTNGSLHEWADPIVVFNEVHRVLKNGGRYCITDLRRDITLFARVVLHLVIPRERRDGFLSSLNASYTQKEILQMKRDTKLKDAQVRAEFWTVIINGQKTN